MAAGDDMWSRNIEYCRRAAMATRPSPLGLGFALALLFATTGFPTRAADRPMMLSLGATSVLLLERPFKTLLIGDPDVVDVLNRDNRSVFLQPLQPGETNVVFLDESSIVIANVGILVCEACASPIMYLDGAARDPADEWPG
jgi:Flp pilus assembly secretin CpaC